ncbi:BrnT family toxin [candidate division NPL-UPA2 bacterium]|nr:BrnT family toxin [candidate division NPL-UPA2 bacterium]
MKYFDWDTEKNAKLKAERKIAFEEIVFSLMHGGLLDILMHPNQKKYPGQRVFVVDVGNYACLVPFVETKDGVFLKTIIPSRKAMRKYLGGEEK